MSSIASFKSDGDYGAVAAYDSNTGASSSVHVPVSTADDMDPSLGTSLSRLLIVPLEPHELLARG